MRIERIMSKDTTPSRAAKYVYASVAAIVMSIGVSQIAVAQAATSQPVRQSKLETPVPCLNSSKSITCSLTADRIVDKKGSNSLTATGSVKLNDGVRIISADSLSYDRDTELATFSGHVETVDKSTAMGSAMSGKQH